MSWLKKISDWYDNWKLDRAYRKKLKHLKKHDPYTYR
jgi:hypothetical protein